MLRAGVSRVALAAALLVPACGFFHREHHAEKPPVIDLNEASLRRVEQLPGVTPSMARRIVEGRPYSDPHDLVERGILTERELDRILDRIRVGDRDD